MAFVPNVTMVPTALKTEYNDTYCPKEISYTTNIRITKDIFLTSNLT